MLSPVRSISAALATAFVFSPAFALDTDHDVGKRIAIVGEIRAGDSQKLREIIEESSPPIDVSIWSLGGDLLEAMKIGEIIREKFIKTYAPDPKMCHELQTDKEEASDEGYRS